MKKINFLILTFVLTTSCLANVDSLKNQLKSQSGIAQIDTYNELAKFYINDSTLGIKYAQLAIENSIQQNYNTGLILGYTYKAKIKLKKGNFIDAIKMQVEL